MRSTLKSSIGLALVAGFFAWAPSAHAQVRPAIPGINPASRPGFSPYLNLLRRDVNPALSYYGLVRPEIQAANSIQQLQQQQNTIAGQLQEQNPANIALPQTGHAAGFQTQSRFFMTKSARGPGSPGTPGTAPAGAQGHAAPQIRR